MGRDGEEGLRRPSRTSDLLLGRAVLADRCVGGSVVRVRRRSHVGRVAEKAGRGVTRTGRGVGEQRRDVGR